MVEQSNEGANCNCQNCRTRCVICISKTHVVCSMPEYQEIDIWYSMLLTIALL